MELYSSIVAADGSIELPPEWIARHGIEVGDDLLLIVDDTSIAIRPSNLEQADRDKSHLREEQA